MTSTDPSRPVIAYFGTDWEGANRTSSHHVARWLGSRYTLLFFECPGLRRPSVSTADAGRLWQKLRSAFAPARHPLPGVTVRTLIQLPIYRSALISRINRMLLRWQVRHALPPDTRPGPLISWFVAPHVGSLAGQIGEDLCVYYCVDDFQSFAGLDGATVRQMDAHLSQAADIVFVTSATLLADKQRLAREVHHAPHGVDVAHFRKATQPLLERPADLPAAGPIIGYFGLVAEWIDLDLVAKLAAARPEWQFVMIGRIAVPAAMLPQLRNVHFLGAKPYDSLPAYGACFDVAIIPYRLTQQVLRANPIKLREYIAMERPIVAVDTPDIRALDGLVTIVNGSEAWERAILEALDNPRDPARSAAQRGAADDMSWHRRMQSIDAVLSAHLSRPR